MFVPLKYNARYLLTRWTGTLMTALTFALVVATFVIVMSLARGIERALTKTGDALNVILVRPGAQSESMSSVTIDRYHIIKNFRGIAKDERGAPLAVPEVLVLVNKPKYPDGRPSNLQIRGIHPDSYNLRPRVKIVAGRALEPGLREVLVSRRVAERFQAMRIGDRPYLGRGQWTIVGLFDAEGTVFDSEAWADYREVMQEFDREAYSSVLARAVDAGAVEGIRKQADEDVRIKLTAKTEEAYYREQTNTAQPLKAFGVFLAVLMSIGASFAGMNTMYANVASRTREIATLRVLGFTPLAILVSFLVESVALASLGGILGCLLSLPINGLTTGTTNFATFSEIVFYFTITPDLMAKGLLFAVFMGAVGGLLPAYSASKTPVLQALRQL